MRPTTEYNFPLTTEDVIVIYLPDDMTPSEAERISRFVRAVAHDGIEDKKPDIKDAVPLNDISEAVKGLQDSVRHNSGGIPHTTMVMTDDLVAALEWIANVSWRFEQMK